MTTVILLLFFWLMLHWWQGNNLTYLWWAMSGKATIGAPSTSSGK